MEIQNPSRPSTAKPLISPSDNLDLEIKAVSSSCKQLIIALKLYSQQQISMENIHTIQEDLFAYLNVITTLLNHSSSAVALLEISDALRLVLSELESSVIENNMDGNGIESGIENVKQVVIALLQELRTLKLTFGDKRRPSSQLSLSIGLPVSNSVPDDVLSGAISAKNSIMSLYDQYDDKKESRDAIGVKDSLIQTTKTQAHVNDVKTINNITIFLQCGSSTKKMSCCADLSLELLLKLFADTFNINTCNYNLQIFDTDFKVFYDCDKLEKIFNGSIFKVMQKSEFENATVSALNSKLESMSQMIQDLHLNSKLNATATPKVIQNKKLEIELLKTEFNASRSSIQGRLNAFSDHLSSFKDQLKQRISETSSIDVSGPPMKSETKSLYRKSKELKQSFEACSELINQLREDILRGSSPPEAYLNTLSAKLSNISTDSTSIQDISSLNKPKWKKQWEETLQLIVSSQQELKDTESTVDLVNNSLVNLSQILNQCQHVLKVKKEKGIVRKFSVPEKDENHDGLATVMNEIAATEINSERRVLALERNLALRKKELELREENEFRRELSKFTLEQKGGIEAIEKQRQIKDKEMMQQLSQNSMTILSQP